MLTRLAIANYRWLLDIRLQWGLLNLGAGINGSDKSKTAGYDGAQRTGK